jgi:hypothetical protein
MANMVDMAQSAEESAEYATSAFGGSPYPYGLCINLDEESLGKLGFSEPPAVGTVMTVCVVVKVTGASESQSMGADGSPGEPEANSSWQITAMGIMNGEGSMSADAMYG